MISTLNVDFLIMIKMYMYIRGPPSAKKMVAGTDQFEAANGVTAATNGITAAASVVTAAAVMSMCMSKNLTLPIQNATSW